MCAGGRRGGDGGRSPDDWLGPSLRLPCQPPPPRARSASRRAAGDPGPIRAAVARSGRRRLNNVKKWAPTTASTSISATSGEAGGGNPAVAGLHRRTELALALAMLGVREHVVLDHPDGGCAEVDGRGGRGGGEVRAVLDDVDPTPRSA